MFNSISGTVTGKTLSSIFIESSGIEWDILVSSISLDSFGSIGARARVFTWLYHREDAMRLFGFASSRERDLFLDLQKVEGIGPKQALKILSSITVPELEAALDGEDVSRLEAAPGIGKKTAQKMILALKGKLTRVDDTGKSRASDRAGEHEDIVRALTDMGFDRKAAIAAVEEIAREIASSGTAPAHTDASAEQEIFRRAIIALSSR
jgi:holliday junction DNA helicase RuvA